MKLYQYVDEFIAEKCSKIGDEYAKADFKLWLIENDWGSVNADAALTAHRQMPDMRTFSTERIGMGPRSFYRVVENESNVQSKAISRMNAQQGEEMVTRWMNEYTYRMYPLAKRDKRARKIMREAQAQIRAVAAIVGVRMDNLFGDEGEGSYV